MRSKLRHVAALVLVLFVSMIVAPPRAYAMDEEVVIGCGYDAQDGQQKCGVLMGAIYWGGEGGNIYILTGGEFLVVLVFVIVSIAVWQEILAGEPGMPDPVCTNCQDGFINRIITLPTP